MNKLIALGLLVITSSVFAAATNDQLVANCRLQMAAGVCRALVAEVDPTAPGPVFGQRRVSMGSLAAVRNAGARMCDDAAEYLQTDPTGERAWIARAYWTPNR